jgi:hypothetical protein
MVADCLAQSLWVVVLKDVEHCDGGLDAGRVAHAVPLKVDDPRHLAGFCSGGHLEGINAGGQCVNVEGCAVPGCSLGLNRHIRFA